MSGVVHTDPSTEVSVANVQPTPRRVWASGGGRAAVWFLAPALVVIGGFFFLPVLAAFFLSFTDFDIYALGDLGTARFIGLRNYAELLQSGIFWKALGNTFYFVLVGGPLSVAVSLGAALLVNAKIVRFKGVFRTIFFAPVVTTLVAVAIVWRYLYHSRYGLLNYGLGALGIEPVDWLGDPMWAMPAIILLAVWKNFGYNMIIFVAGLQNIPDELYEAAQIDGAGPWQQFRTITLPLLAPTFLFVGLITMIGYFQLFAEPYVMTEGGPLQSTVSIVYLMYEEGFKWWNLGYASAVAFILFLIMLVGTFIQLRFQKAGADGMNRTVKQIALYAGLLVTAMLTAFPLLWMLSASLMPQGEASTFPPPLLPSRATLGHYADLFARAEMGRYLLNSFLLATSVTLISLLFNSMAGYAFAKLRFRGRDGLFQTLLAALVIPAQVAMLPLFLQMRALGLVNSYGGVIVPAAASIFGIFLIRQFALSIPESLLEAARIDGATEFRIYWSVALPLMKPILVTLAIFTFMGVWNDFMWPLIVLTDDSMYTLPVALATLARERVQDNELMMAGAVVTVLPVLFVFLALQKYYIQGIMMGSIKG